MARYRSNPDIFGVSFEDLALEGVIGVGATAVLTDRLTSPILRSIIPGAHAASMVGKLVDALATVAGGWLLAKVVGMIYPSARHSVERGAGVLAVAKVTASVLPGYSPLGPLPVPSAFSIPGLGSGSSVAQLNSGIALTSVLGGTQQVAASGSTVALGVGSTGL